jgi:mannose-6-phosphate isomerase-like protein (cupin superfamily)
MRKKINKIFTDLVQYYKNIENVEETINEELQTKPACVHMSERVNEYEKLHIHKYYEVLYVEKGSISYLIDDEEYIINPGDLILIPPHTEHRLLKFTTDISSRYILLFSEKFLNKYSTHNTKLLKVFERATEEKKYILSILEKDKFTLEKLLKNTSNIMLSEGFGMDIEYISKFLKTIIIINGISIEKSDELAHNNSAIVNKITKFITLNIANKILIEDIANHLALSVSRVSHIFKEETGISILKYINKNITENSQIS